MSRIFTVSFASVYPHYVTKVEKKGRTKAELDHVFDWLTGYDEAELRATWTPDDVRELLRGRPAQPERWHDHRADLRHTGGGIEDPLMQKIRYLDRLVDELAKGRAMEKVLRA